MKVSAIQTAALFLLLIGCKASIYSDILNKEKKKSSFQEAGQGSQKEDSDRNNSANLQEQVCFKPSILLPTALSDLKEKYNWQATGEYENVKQVIHPPLAAKMHGKDVSLIVVANPYRFSAPRFVYSINGRIGFQEWRSQIEVAYNAPALGDIDKDGKIEVVVYTNEGTISVLSDLGKEKWRSSERVSVNSSGAAFDYGPSLEDIDNDGEVEIVAGKLVLEGKTGRKKFEISEDSVQIVSMTGEVNSRPGTEIITTKGIYEGVQGLNICEFPQPFFANFGFAKLRENDDHYTIIGPDLERQRLLAYNGENCELIFSKKIPEGSAAAPTIADLDGDQELEIGIAGYGYYVTFEPNGEVVWQRSIEDGSGATGSVAFDFNGDGASEIVYNDEKYLRIFNGKTGIIIYETKNSSGTGSEYPIIVDVDGDGHAEIVASSNSDWGTGSNFGVRVFSSPQNDWIGTRQIWNEDSYRAINIANDGKIIGIEKDKIWSPWLSTPHLTGFRSNIPIRQISRCK